MAGPINRKKNVTGKASEDSMQLHGSGRKEGPVGASDGYRDRREQQNAQRAGADGAHPAARPKTPTGQTSGSLNTQGTGMGSARPQQQRPSGSSSAQNSFAALRPQQTTQQQTRPQQTASQARPQQTAQQSSQQARPQFASTAGSSQTGVKRSGGSMGKFILIILAVLVLGGGGGLSGLFGGGSDNPPTVTNPPASYYTTQAPTVYTNTSNTSNISSTASNNTASGGLLGGYGASMLQQLLGGGWYSEQTGYGAASTGSASAASTAGGANMTALNRSVASGSRSKYTAIRGNGRDTFTIMVYMCGADLESKSAMATKDLQEMLNAKFGANVRVIVYTGGSTKWRNNLVSSSVNQVWQVKDGNLNSLVSDAGTGAMTNPDTLTAFIQYCAKNFSANRYALILWDHGSGSVSGYGYDERNPRSGSMSLAGLNTAFKNGGVKFDFIGFDTCLMATVENALMASNYADYLIASEETEPGIGWYYTDWLTALGSNTSMATLDIGKQICDDFVARCNSECRGQQTTLSMIDLAELSNTVPAKLTAFSQSISSLINNKEYKTVSNARNGSREFAASSRIDQVDLTDLCNNLGTQESAALASVLKGAVKYNRTNISDAYGLSVYFPYQRVSNVDKAVSTYAAIGMDASYAQAIRDFASVEAGGQAVSGGSGSAIPSLFGLMGDSGSASSSGDMIGQLLSSFLGGSTSAGGLDASALGFLSGRSVTDSALSEYLTANHLDSNTLVFKPLGQAWALELTPEQWALVSGVDLNLFYDNGYGYIDLGLDNLFEFDDSGRLVADTSGTWLAINGQPVAYYHETTDYVSDSDWRITGRVPALLNGDRVELLIVFDQDHEGGYVAGARTVYMNGETDTVAKAITEIAAGDTITFLADLYDYDQHYNDSYQLGNTITVAGALAVSDVYLPDASKISATYRVTDIYNQAYWTPVVGK